jgi:predicted enzyme related to lactoylglutathione lyase
MEQSIHATKQHTPWNKGKLVGQKAPLKLKDIWAIRVRLQIGKRTCELALFNLAIDSKLRSCDLVRLRVRDVCHGSLVAARAMVMQQKTQRPVQFEITEQTRESLLAWIRAAGRRSDDYLFPSRIHGSPHLSTRQYARIVRGWVREIGLESSAYGTHTMRRTKASLIYRRTKNLRVVQLLLGHTKLESTVRYLGIEVDDALEMAEQTEVSIGAPVGVCPMRAPTGQVRSSVYPTWQGGSSHSFSIVELHFTHRASESETMAIPVSRLILYVKDVARIAAFYQQHFGMKPLPGSEKGWVEISSGKRGCNIALHQAASSQKSGAAMKIVFGVSNVKKFKAEREADGLRFGPVHSPGEFEFANAKDPAGNSIQISSRGIQKP